MRHRLLERALTRANFRIFVFVGSFLFLLNSKQHAQSADATLRLPHDQLALVRARRPQAFNIRTSSRGGASRIFAELGVN